MTLLLLLSACDPGTPVQVPHGTVESDPEIIPAACTTDTVEARYDLREGRILGVALSSGKSWWAPDAQDETLVTRLTNYGTATIEGDWTNCGYPTYEVTDEAGSVVARGSNDDGMDCDDIGHLTLAPGEAREDSLAAPPLPAGSYTLGVSAEVGVLVDGSASALSYNAAQPVQVGGEGCAAKEGSGRWPAGLDLTLSSARGVVVPSDDALTLAGAGFNSAQDIPGDWLECNYPRLFLLDPAATEVWSHSEADGIPCDPVTSWAGNETFASDATIGASVFAEPGVWKTGVRFSRDPGDPSGLEVFELLLDETVAADDDE